MTKQKVYDVVIIGGGMAGLPLGLCLAKAGKKVACIDRDNPDIQATEKFDGRTVAISAGGSEIFSAAGIWEKILKNACPINDIKIMDSGSATLLEFMSDEIEDQSFGHIIENRLVRKELFKAAKSEKNLDHIAPCSITNFEVHEEAVEITLGNGNIITTKLIVGADGRNSWVREQAGIRTRGWEYNQRAVICIIEHENSHQNNAIEDFRPEGPFAVLPMIDDEDGRHRSSIVWTEHGNKKRSIMNLSEEDFYKKLNDRMPDFYGETKKISALQAYPLGLIHAERYTSNRLALVSDAAHGIHPIAGQGLNIGLRDVNKLVELINQHDDPGSEELLKEYQRSRRLDNMGMIFATDSLNKLFSNNILPVRMARRFGLKTIEKLPFAKQFFMKQAMGLRN